MIRFYLLTNTANVSRYICTQLPSICNCNPVLLYRLEKLIKMHRPRQTSMSALFGIVTLYISDVDIHCCQATPVMNTAAKPKLSYLTFYKR